MYLRHAATPSRRPVLSVDDLNKLVPDVVDDTIETQAVQALLQQCATQVRETIKQGSVECDFEVPTIVYGLADYDYPTVVRGIKADLEAGGLHVREENNEELKVLYISGWRAPPKRSSTYSTRY
jgi:hypothetical protein